MPLLSQQKLKQFKALKQKKYRQREGKFLIVGIKICQEAFSANVSIIAFLFCPQIVTSKIINDFINICEHKRIPYYEISRNMVGILSDTVHSQGLICVVHHKIQQIDFFQKSFIVAIDAAQDPGNVGTIIRTSDWFGIDAVLLGNGTVELHNSKVLRTTMGSIFHFIVVIFFEGHDCDGAQNYRWEPKGPKTVCGTGHANPTNGRPRAGGHI